MLACGFGELGDNDRGVDHAVGGDVEGVTGVIIEPRQHLHIGAVGEADVGHVGLPGFVRKIGLEPDVGALGPFAWFGFDQRGGDQVAMDR